MINSLKEADFSKRQQDGSNTAGDGIKTSKVPSSSVSWSRLKDPRIVRVSRAFGGKDRHSKVRTLRGLRDRRVRLSVPTAIQLYDLQDKLGLNQPSKVVDWLLDAAKHEIDELPPLPIPPGSLLQELHPMLISNNGIGAASHNQSDKQGLKISSCSLNWNEHSKLPSCRPNFLGSDANLRGESKGDQAAGEGGNKDCDLGDNGEFVSSDYHLFPRPNHPFFPGFLNNNVNPHNPLHGWNATNLSLSHTTLQREGPPSVNVGHFPSMPSGSQFLLRPPGPPQSYLPPCSGALVELEPKQINFEISSSSQNPLSSPVFSMSQPMRPFHLGMTTNFFPALNNSGSEQNKED